MSDSFWDPVEEQNTLAAELVRQVCKNVGLKHFSVLGAGNQYVINWLNVDESILGKVWFTFYGPDSLYVKVDGTASSGMSRTFNLSHPESFKMIEEHVKYIFRI